MAAQHPILFLISKARRALINRWRWSRVRQAHDGGLALYYLGASVLTHPVGPHPAGPYGRAALRLLVMVVVIYEHVVV